MDRVSVARTGDQNALLHVLCGIIRDHVRANGPKLPAGEDGKLLIKEMCKQAFGPKMVVGKIKINKPSSRYTLDEMIDVITQIIAWAAMDLGLVIEIRGENDSNIV